MERLAKRLQNELNLDVPPGFALTNISSAADRYVLFKAGPVLCVNVIQSFVFKYFTLTPFVFITLYLDNLKVLPFKFFFEIC